jgi:cytochrome bd-type quinol oxidase subunit 2
MEVRKEDASLGELFGDLSREMSTLVHQEVDLAKAELAQKARSVGKDASFMAMGGALAYAGALAIVATLIIALAYVMPWWLAALIVGIVVACAGYLMIDHGRKSLSKTNLAPQRTMQTLQEDAQWARNQMR